MTSITDRADINQVLLQMRELRGQAQGPANSEAAAMDSLRQTLDANGLRGPAEAGQVRGIDGAARPEGPGFGELLREAVDGVNDTQAKAAELATAYEMGDKNVDLTQVMIQMQKASVSFEAMTQVRNRLISAYQDIMNMPI